VLLKKTFLVLLPLLIFYLVFSKSSMFIGVIFSITITNAGFLLDEKRQIHLLLNSLPYTRKEIVSAKYLGACVITSLVLLTIFIGNLTINGAMISWKEILFVICLSLLFFSVSLPFSYQFKSQYLMYASIAAFAAYLVILNVFIPNLHDLIREFVGMLLAMQEVQLYVLASCIVLAMYILSWLLSIRIYHKKVF